MPDSSLPEESPVVAPDPETEETAFMPLEIVDSFPFVETEYGQEVTLQAALNRDDVLVNYQWQMDLPAPKVEETDLLYDYSEDLSTDYYFPYFDISEAELLEMNPDATWPGIEMYLEANSLRLFTK